MSCLVATCRTSTGRACVRFVCFEGVFGYRVACLSFVRSVGQANRWMFRINLKLARINKSRVCRPTLCERMT